MIQSLKNYTKEKVLTYLLSMATNQWVDRDAREEVRTLVSELNGTRATFSFSKDLVLKAVAWSMNQKGRVEHEVHDLEFALATPGAKSGWVRAAMLDETANGGGGHEPGDLAMRSNLADREDVRLVPGEVLYRTNPYYFRVEQNPPKIQVEERLYYEPCAVCRRRSNDPLCRCASAPGWRNQTETRP